MENQNNKYKFGELYGLLVFFFLALFIYAKFGPGFPVSMTTQEKGQPMTVEGVGTAVAAPDSAKVNLGIEESGSSLTTVQSNTAAKTKKLVDAIKGLGIDEKDIKTTSYQVNPQYSFDTRTQRVTGYMVSVSYQITVNDTEKVNDLLDTAVANGANQASGITFELSDETKKGLMDEARKKASDEAKEKAKSLAKASGVSLGKILSVSEFSNNSPMPIYKTDSAIGGAIPEVVNTQIQPGQSELSLTIVMSYEIR